MRRVRDRSGKRKSFHRFRFDYWEWGKRGSALPGRLIELLFLACFGHPKAGQRRQG